MQVISEYVKPDTATGQWFTAMVQTILLMIGARDDAGKVCLRLHLGNRGNAARQGLVIETVVPSLKTFCAQLGFHVKDLEWHYREGAEPAGATEDTATETSPEQFSAARREDGIHAYRHVQFGQR